MRRHVRTLAATVGLLLAAGGCGTAAGAARAPAKNPGHLACRAPFNAGSRLPGLLNPAYPSTGLYPAPGGLPSGGAGVTLLAQGAALVVDYGQPLESGGVTTKNEVVQGTRDGVWWRAPLVAGYPFRLFGPNVPMFALVPAPVRTGAAASGLRAVWLVTEWDSGQTITVLRGTPAQAAALRPWKALPTGISAANAAAAGAQVASALHAGWRNVATVTAAPPCGAAAGQIDPFGDRAELELPLGVPLLVVAPEYGATVLEIEAA
jgi:hypothetical protein